MLTKCTEEFFGWNNTVLKAVLSLGNSTVSLQAAISWHCISGELLNSKWKITLAFVFKRSDCSKMIQLHFQGVAAEQRHSKLAKELCALIVLGIRCRSSLLSTILEQSNQEGNMREMFCIVLFQKVMWCDFRHFFNSSSAMHKFKWLFVPVVSLILLFKTVLEL